MPASLFVFFKSLVLPSIFLIIMKSYFKSFVLLLLLNFLPSLSFSQCIEIESILVDACEGNTNAEGQNEMVRFKVGDEPLNTNQMSVDWPSNNWGGLIQNAATAQKVDLINQEIEAAGGCGQVLEPTNGVLPANATVIIVTSNLFDISLNPFGAINETIYIIFQDSDTINGHFGNFGTPATRTLTISFGACSDSKSYDRSLLVDQNGEHAAGNGATVNFLPDGTTTYTNNGCSAPVATPVFDIIDYPTISCANSTFSLLAEASNYQSIEWSSTDGTFSSPTDLSTDFTVNDTDATSISITLTMTNMCGVETSKTIQVELETQTEPVFSELPNQICNSDDLPVLPTISDNGISGVWSPSVVSADYEGDYIFTPDAGQCAKTISTQIIVSELSLTLSGECDGSEYFLTAHAVSDSEINYVWRDENGYEVGDNSPIFNVSEYMIQENYPMLPLTFTVEATTGSCVLTESIVVTSTYCSIQKGVSPNGDMKNDFFDLRNTIVLKLSIYNRYGTEVYSKLHYSDEWHGQNKKGELLPVGTYFYSILTGENETITGWIQLMY